MKGIGDQTQRDMLILVSDDMVFERQTTQGWAVKFPAGLGGRGARAVYRVLKRRGWIKSTPTKKGDTNLIQLTETGEAVLSGSDHEEQ